MNEHAIHPEMVCQGDGLVCPNCYGKLDGRSQIPVQNINGYPTRSYGGACSRPSCGLGFEVVQFQMNGKWYINHYQLYKTQPWGDKITVVPFPGQGETEPIQELKPESGQPKEIPVLIVGPGGDYRHTVEITGESLLASLAKILRNAVETVEAMIPLWRIKDKQHDGNT